VRVSSRQDFIALTLVTVPLLVAPIPWAAARLWPLLLLWAACGVVYFRLLPARESGWTLYHLNETQWRRAWASAADECGLAGRWRGRTWVSAQGKALLRYSVFPWLRSVSVQLRPARLSSGTHVHRHSCLSTVEQVLDRQLVRVRQMPSSSGVCLLSLGVAMMTLPIWLIGRHAPDMAMAFARLFG